MVRILIVEDNEELLALVAGYFKDKGSFDVFTAADGNAALKLVDEKDFDIAILDIMLPGPNGFEICKALRNKSRCPIVFLTALGNEDNILKGYEIGADEYMVKPFSLMILYTKCLILMDRKVKKQDEKVLESGDIRLYPSRMQVFVGDNEIELAPKEYFLLKALLDNIGHVLGRQKLLDLVWGMDYFGSDRVVDTTVKNVRHKLGSSGDQIKTIRGGGYKAV